MSSEDLVDHGRRIAALERKISQLYQRLGREEPTDVVASEDPRLIELVQAGNEMQAVKLYRELTGAGLAESKQAVDELIDTYRPAG
ncbi:MAG TPA: hypothetical protein VK326_03830 [Solirubrobacterales bacterium]|nr:hypothetical protein [Solirubrobacterales bacterium]